eukprot:gb/GECH01009841.1/.p1 GENE.gb/GECH01009841.1/~~gb/GECH01009841.1/.p1  ORF type:complete len:105 (+),score=17.38 gb/GECH01009841.1/:1-315(+)
MTTNTTNNTITKPDPSVEAALHGDDSPAEYYGLATVMAGALGLMMRNKAAAWVAVLTCLASLANMRTARFDLQQTITSTMLACICLFMNYFTVRPEQLVTSPQQ